MNSRARDCVAQVREGVICIAHLNQGVLSIKTTIEDILQELERNGFDVTPPIIYRDGSGMWDAVIHDRSQFLGFHHPRVTSPEYAIRLVKEHLGNLRG